MTKRIEWADALKGFLILMVVLGHSIQSVCQQTDMDFLQNYFWNLIYSFHMPAFMAVSGYLSFKSNGGVFRWFNIKYMQKIQATDGPFLALVGNNVFC